MHDVPSVSRPSAQASTSESKATKTTGTKRKSRRRPSRRQNKSSKSSNEVGNASPLDNTELPDIVITLDDSEYFSDEEVQLSSDSSDSSASPAYVASSSRLMATSDCSTVPIDQLMSPDLSSDSDIRLLTPEPNSDFRINPLSQVAWSDSE